MQLSAELFCHIIKTLHSDEGQSARHEKRKEGRVGVRCSIEVSPETYDDQGKKLISVKTRDISPSGVGFISHQHFNVGLLMDCRLPRQGGDFLEIKLTVRHCTKVASGLYNVGATFARSASMFDEADEAEVPTKAKAAQPVPTIV